MTTQRASEMAVPVAEVSAPNTLVPPVVRVKRSDPAYMAHAYLTKVPILAIEPFLRAYTRPGNLVLDPFAGSGMTGIASAVLGRRAVLYDISVLGGHIATNYLNLVEPGELRSAAQAAIDEAKRRVGEVYVTTCARCGGGAELSRSIWSIVYACPECSKPIRYYDALECVQWKPASVRCPHCRRSFKRRGAERVGEERVADVVACPCTRSLVEQPPGDPLVAPRIEGLSWPDVEIGEDRQMYQASALGKHGLATTASFFSDRNRAALAALRAAIGSPTDGRLRSKLLFAFTAILARASKRYQWSRGRPLNAANQNYYVAPVFYEWNVFDLFGRKVEAAIRSDEFLRQRRPEIVDQGDLRVEYRVRSSESLDLADESVDYVFTDPPFGSNIFYSDMNLFQEAWLGVLTDPSEEMVVDRSGNGDGHRSAERYERLLTRVLQECARVLKPGGWLSLVFSNSRGALWSVIQRATHEAGFAIDPDAVVLLDKGQRSVKGLASGVEKVVTLDLVLSMRKGTSPSTAGLQPPEAEGVDAVVRAMVAGVAGETPSHVYLELLKEGLRRSWDLSAIDYATVTETLLGLGYEIDARTAKLVRKSQGR